MLGEKAQDDATEKKLHRLRRLADHLDVHYPVSDILKKGCA